MKRTGETSRKDGPMKHGDVTVSLEEAKAEVEKAVRRIALLHLAFAETIVKELGEEAGRELIVKAIRRYGVMIGRKARRDAVVRHLPLTPGTYETVPGEGLPAFGTHSSIGLEEDGGETLIRCTGCVWAQVWREHGGEELGRLYCLVDPAQVMAFNPEWTLVHLKTEPDGDACCEMVFRKTTEREREDFAEDRDWSYLDLDRE
jgi:hypothetical protein